MTSVANPALRRMLPWRDATMRRIGLLVVAVTLIMAVVDVALSLSLREFGAVLEIGILATAFGTVLIISLRAVPRNGAVWAMSWAAFFGVGSQLGATVGTLRTGFTTIEIEEGLVAVSPADLDLLAAAGFSVALSVWVLSTFLLGSHVLILFPRGVAPSPRWRWLAWLSGTCMSVLAIATAVAVGPWVDRSYAEMYRDEQGAAGALSNLMVVPMLISVAALVHLIVRFRRSEGEERLQYFWVTLALGLYVLTILGFGWVPDPLGQFLNPISLALVAVAFGIAITKYRLFDIDVVISRSLLFIALAGFITLIYAGVVVGLGSLFEGSSVWLSIAAIALVAVVFEPVRLRLQRWVNRLVYGQRATPYEVLSDLTGRLAATESEEGLLERMALRLAEGTGADRAVVWIRDGSGFRASAAEPGDDQPAGVYDRLEEVPGTVVPIDHDGETLGALSVEKRRGDMLTPIELRLVQDLAGSAGLVMRRRRLDAELARKAEELAESRRRLVDAQDIERRRLERDLNDGATQRVLGLKLKLTQAAQLARQEGSTTAARMVEQMTGEAQDAIDQIRALARGIYPPLLEEQGVAAAVDRLVSNSALDVQVEAAVSGRYPLPVEAAIYFAVSEALTNAAKHGRPPIRLRLSDAGGELVFEVSDSGSGFDSRTVRRGSGLDNMDDRLDALGGTLVIDARPGGPATVAGKVPVAGLARV